ncbi:MAG: dihydroorotate dehydrogenase [Candidatus Micrarchaeia archaeon]|jgi:dihydroorotate dehydrogenase (NAD+) catalytic subunit
MNVDISVSIAGLKMKNPTVLASGVTDVTKKALENAAGNGAGAVTTKSISLEPRKGHNTPILAETPSGFINAVGLANPGIEEALKEFGGWKSDAPLILNVVGKDAGEFSLLAEKIAKSGIHVDAVELALSCPHTPGYGTMAGQNTPEATLQILKTVRAKLNVPLIAKLSPNISALGEVAKAAESGGASAINMGNSVGPGMVINIERKAKVLSFGFGGLTGPAIKPIAVRCVYDVYESVKIPIIGTGGITNGRDAIEMMMAGASAVGVGTAVYYRGAKVFGMIANEMQEWMKKNEISSLKEIVGVAHNG